MCSTRNCMVSSESPTPTTVSSPTTSNANNSSSNHPTSNTRESLAKCLRAMETATRERASPITTEGSRVTTAASVLHLQPQIAWLTSARAGSVLFVRPCYDILFVLATSFMACRQDEHHVVLTGSHGVGKRSFLSYMIYRLRRWAAPPKIVLDLPGLFALIDSDGEVELGTRGVSFQAELCERQTYYFCDAMDRGRTPLCEGYLHAKSIVVMPPIESAEAAFKPKPQRLTFVMPAWSPGELSSCREACYPHVDHEELLQRQEMWGGLVKWVLAESAAVSAAQFTRSLTLLTLERAAELAKACGYVETMTDLTEGHYLVQLDVEPNDTFQLRAAFLCSRLACAQVVDATTTKEHIAFVQQHRASFRVQELVEQVEAQLMRRLLLV